MGFCEAGGTHHGTLDAEVVPVEGVGEDAVLVLEAAVVPDGRGVGRRRERPSLADGTDDRQA